MDASLNNKGIIKMRDFRSLEQKIRQVWLDEAEARNTAARKKVENVGRPKDDNKDPETSKLAKQGEIKKKIIDEEAEDNQKEKDPRKLTGGKTEVILDPKTDDRPEEQTMEDEKQKKTVKQENKKIGAKSGVKEEVDLDEAGRILPDLTQTEPKPQHSKEYQAKIDREKSNRAIAKKERAKFNEFKRYSFRRWMATQDGSK